MASMTAKRTFQILENQTLWEAAARFNEVARRPGHSARGR